MDERFDPDHVVGVALNGNPTGNISVREGNKTAIVDPGKKKYARRNHSKQHANEIYQQSQSYLALISLVWSGHRYVHTILLGRSYACFGTMSNHRERPEKAEPDSYYVFKLSGESLLQSFSIFPT